MGRRNGTGAAARRRAIFEAANLVRDVAGPRQDRERTKEMIARAADRLGWTQGRTEDIWQREARVIPSEEMDHLRATAAHERGRCAATWEDSEI